MAWPWHWTHSPQYNSPQCEHWQHNARKLQTRQRMPTNWCTTPAMTKQAKSLLGKNSTTQPKTTRVRVSGNSARFQNKHFQLLLPQSSIFGIRWSRCVSRIYTSQLVSHAGFLKMPWLQQIPGGKVSRQIFACAAVLKLFAGIVTTLDDKAFEIYNGRRATPGRKTSFGNSIHNTSVNQSLAIPKSGFHNVNSGN